MNKENNLNKMMKFFTPILALSLAVSIPAVSFATDPATPTVTIEVPEQVCSGLDSGKNDVNSGPTLEITAPEGQLISGYCVKAGSTQQGNGPQYVTVDPPAKSVTISHASGKDISHWSASFITEVVSTPSPSVTPSEPASPSPEPTPELPTEEPQPTLIPTPGPTEPEDSPEPTVTPTTPAPSVTPTEPAISCPGLSAVGRFANASGNEAVLTVKVNGEVVPFNLIGVGRETPLPGVFTVSATDFEFPGIIHLLDLNVGDVVEITLTDGRTSDSDSGVVRDSCGVGVEVGIEKFVGPVIPTKPPVTPTKPVVGPQIPTPVPTETKTVVKDAYSGATVTTTVIRPNSDGGTVVIDQAAEELPRTGVNVGTLVVIALLLIFLGYLGVRSGRLRR